MGGSQNDLFTFADFASVSGTVSGGAGYNTINLTDRTDSITINLETGSDPIFGGFFLWKSLVANTANSNSSVGADAANTWTISDANAGDINGLSFSGFVNLTGGTGDDSFVFQPTGSIEGIVDGGLGTNTLDYSNQTTGIAVNLQTSTVTVIPTGFSNIDKIIGSGVGDDVLVGSDTDTVWNINNNAGDAGTLTYGSAREEPVLHLRRPRQRAGQLPAHRLERRAREHPAQLAGDVAQGRCRDRHQPVPGNYLDSGTGDRFRVTPLFLHAL